ncbi:50S ribosomal protein L6 [Candidatus Micrarchaeota archaeon]|nr:50S ribosomal protein L6 [Candidatus Micrarchaeota archaeon]
MYTNNTEIEIPEGVTAVLESESAVKISGKNGELKRDFGLGVKLSVEGRKVSISTKKKPMLNTVRAHLLNMSKGVVDGFERKMKICYAHFPMNVKVQGNHLVIGNFIGEKAPRKAKIASGVKIDVKGQDLTISGPDKEAVGQTVSSITAATKIKKKDSRIFQDGIYPVKG